MPFQHSIGAPRPYGQSGIAIKLFRVDAAGSSIVAVWPDKADPTYTRDCASGITAVIPGENPTSNYLPNRT